MKKWRARMSSITFSSLAFSPQLAVKLASTRSHMWRVKKPMSLQPHPWHVLHIFVFISVWGIFCQYICMSLNFNEFCRPRQFLMVFNRSASTVICSLPSRPLGVQPSQAGLWKKYVSLGPVKRAKQGGGPDIYFHAWHAGRCCPK